MLEIKDACLAVSGQGLFERLSLQVAPGEVVTLTGASGSGKSSLLGWIVGAQDSGAAQDLRAVHGEVWLDGQRVDTRPIEARRIGILFQDDLLFPHLSVGENLAFALPAALRGRAARRAKVEATLGDIGLAGCHDRDPFTLSGGQRARVSLMRALLAEPRALLLDEPFSRLDAALRAQFRGFVFEQIARLRIPTLLVTHDLGDIPAGGRVFGLETWRPAEAGPPHQAAPAPSTPDGGHHA